MRDRRHSARARLSRRGPQIAELTKAAPRKLIVDVRRTSGGSLDGGLALARLFVASGTLTSGRDATAERETIATAAGDGSVTLPVDILIDNGTSGAAEIFASALLGNKRAELIGEHTIGRAGEQQLVKLPDGSGLWLTTTKFLDAVGRAAARERAGADGCRRRA